MKRVALVTVMAAVALFGPLAFAASAQTEVNVIDVASAVDEVWIIVAGILVMFMQAGFALVESGFTRAKNAGNIIMKNFMDFSVGALSYWAIGFALAYGGSSVGGFLATGNWFFSDDARASEWFFQAVFAATAATIISGAVAERVKFTAYLMYTPFITGLIYPIVSHWVWNGEGWLAEQGFVDFAGSGVVHLTGAVAALAAVLVIGPRLGKYAPDGKARTIPGHSLTLGALGVSASRSTELSVGWSASPPVRPPFRSGPRSWSAASPAHWSCSRSCSSSGPRWTIRSEQFLCTAPPASGAS